MPSSKILFAALVAAFHSFASAEEIITTAPTPTLVPRQVAGAPGTPILSTLKYAYSDLPHQVYPFAVLRGPQFGYNDCVKQGDGPETLCQTLIFNSLSDFCLWGSPTTQPNGTIGDQEARVISYCTQPGHGSRILPAGVLTGAQFTRTSAYIQIVGFIKNEGVNITPDDQGGELDPHGADLQGNPLGGVVYSNGTIDSKNGELAQVLNWNMFIGGNQFCMKVCFNDITKPDYCENRYDLIGCSYNMPSAAKDGEFTECEGELQDVVGVYTSNGAVTTWTMTYPLNTPPPYQPRVPASSNCKTFASTELFAAAPTPTGGSSSTTGTGGQTAPTGGSTSKTSTGATGTQTNSPGASFKIDVPFTGLAAVIGLIVLGGRLV